MVIILLWLRKRDRVKRIRNKSERERYIEVDLINRKRKVIRNIKITIREQTIKK